MLHKKKVVPKCGVKVMKVDIVTSDDIKIYYTGKFQDFTARYIINNRTCLSQYYDHNATKRNEMKMPNSQNTEAVTEYRR